jgi:hypothetical protein
MLKERARGRIQAEAILMAGTVENDTDAGGAKVVCGLRFRVTDVNPECL